MTRSMTGFATRQGAQDIFRWSWEMRGVNARGLDLRIRVPDGIEGLEQAIRSTLGQGLSRGNVTVNLRLTQDETGQDLALDQGQLDRVLDALARIEDRACERGLTLSQPTAADVLAQRGVLQQARQDGYPAEIATALKADIAPLLADFIAMRDTEGQALKEILAGQLDQIETLTTQAADLLTDRVDATRAQLQANLLKITDQITEVEPDRIAQELALIAVKQDVTEEIDRLRAHVVAARDLLAADGPVGRKLDFLSQEFNREANTLCSKAQFKQLTSIGLDLKACIDQMREQIQNVE